jgi:hypothetical protein
MPFFAIKVSTGFACFIDFSGVAVDLSPLQVFHLIALPNQINVQLVKVFK